MPCEPCKKAAEQFSHNFFPIIKPVEEPTFKIPKQQKLAVIQALALLMDTVQIGLTAVQDDDLPRLILQLREIQRTAKAIEIETQRATTAPTMQEKHTYRTYKP